MIGHEAAQLAAGAADARLDRADGDVEGGGDFLVGEALDLMEDEGGAEFGGQFGKGLVKVAHHFLAGGLAARIGALGGEGKLAGFFAVAPRHVLHGDDPPVMASPGGQVVPGLVGGDAVDPGGESAFPPKGADAAGDLEQDRLGEVACLVISPPEQMEGRAEDPVLMEDEELVERLGIAALGRHDEGALVISPFPGVFPSVRQFSQGDCSLPRFRPPQ